ncbi:related to mmt1-mitochondrial iron transport protein [Ceraceosorus bombacis]|uniref:Related to mmt1-mitochondrial iron transport protein n=1 Tax=Ceraceosorus bombacis TaxID=401625 RepID=A0A0P1BLW1_9BASI|nr:related to mmt1-mitochondrial iron transport protein [Ceraceosorus bombacis]
MSPGLPLPSATLKTALPRDQTPTTPGSPPRLGALKLIRNDPSEPRQPSRGSVTRARRANPGASGASLFGFRNSTTETSTAFAEAADAAADAAARQTQKALQLRHLEHHQQRIIAAAQAFASPNTATTAEQAATTFEPAGNLTPDQDIMAKGLSEQIDGGARVEQELRKRKDPDAARKHHEHSHSHGFGHSHSHAHEGSAEEADKLFAALKGQGDRGSNITLVGLGANLVLCIAKAVAGVFLHSASLLADAAHSLSDMFSDLVTLFCWRMSRKPPSTTHPLGYGKYETMGGLGVSVVLVAGAFGIGAHSYSLLIEALEPTLRSAPAVIQNIGTLTGALASKGAHLHEHADVGDRGILDPNAMWPTRSTTAATRSPQVSPF